MTASHSATPDELDSLGGTLEAQVEIVNKMIADVDTPLGSIAWTGPARDAFQGEWDTNFKSALGKLNDAFSSAGKSCKDRAEGTRVVLGATSA